MKKKYLLILTALVFAITGAKAQNVGQTAPDFTLKTLTDVNYTLSNNRGDVIFVFLVGNTCPLCIASAPAVKSAVLNQYNGRANFQALIIDTWDGSKASVQGFKNTTGMSGTYLLNGSSVGQKWSSTYDRLVVIDGEGKMVFKGTSAAGNDASAAATAISNALGNLTTAIPEVGTATELFQNYPNPCSERTRVEFRLVEAAQVKLSLFDITGKELAVPVDEYLAPGSHSRTIDVSMLKQGMYFYRLEAGEFSGIKKLIIR